MSAKSAKAYVAAIVAALKEVADPERAPAMQAYMKDVAPFLGVASTLRRETVRKVDAEIGKPADDDVIAIVQALWSQRWREFHYIAVDLLAARSKKLEPTEVLKTVEALGRRTPWWDTIDGLTKAAGTALVKDPSLEPVLDRWLVDDSFWIARLAILHQLGRGAKTDKELLFRICLTATTRDDADEFFIRKAIGWALRDYAWANPAAVKSFVHAHRGTFAPLTIREALKNIDDPRAGRRLGKV